MAISTQTCRPRRRWCQFSLRSLMIALTLATVGFGWARFMRQRADTNRRRVAAGAATVDALKRLGGAHRVADYERRSPTWLEDLFDDPGPGDDPVRVLNVNCVDLLHTKVTDTDLQHLKGLTTLTTLYLYDTNITDAGLEHVENLSNLERLSLGDTKVTDEGIIKLVRRLTNLRELDLRRTMVNDRCLKNLKALKHLEDLDLAYTKVTDAGLEHLKGLTTLVTLYLDSSHVTDAGLAHLKGLAHLDSVCPKTRIHFGDR